MIDLILSILFKAFQGGIYFHCAIVSEAKSKKRRSLLYIFHAIISGVLHSFVWTQKENCGVKDSFSFCMAKKNFHFTFIF